MKRVSRLTRIILALLVMVPFSSHGISEQEMRRMKKYDYFLSLGLMAWMGMEYQGLKATSRMVTDFTVTDLARESLLKWTGIKAFRMGAASSVLAITGRNIVDWAIGGVKAAARDSAELKDDPQYKSNWLRSFFLYVFIPQLIKREVIGRSFNKLSDSVGISYPQWVYNNTFTLLIAWHLSEFAGDFCSSLLESVYDFFVPKTRAQQYLQYKRYMAQRAAAMVH